MGGRAVSRIWKGGFQIRFVYIFNNVFNDKGGGDSGQQETALDTVLTL